MWLLLLSCVEQRRGPDGAEDADADTADGESLDCPAPVSFEDPGTACLTEDGLWASLVEVGACSTVLAAGCEVSVDDSRIVVTGWAEAQGPCGSDSQAWPLEASVVWADCGLPELADGTWTLVYAGYEVDVVLPAVEETCVGGGRPSL